MTSSSDANRARVYCGTYTTTLDHVDGKATGIGIFDLELGTGKLFQVGESPPVTNCSHMCLSQGVGLSQEDRFLYAVNEVTSHEQRSAGTLTVFAVVEQDQSLMVIQTVSSHGAGPAYVNLDGSGNFLFLANYVAGNVVSYPIAADGRLGPSVANVAHSGSSVNQDRQEAPHPHAIVPSPDNRFVYVPDLGIDKIVAYEFDAKSGTLTARPDLDARTQPGTGPRHFVFSPNGRFAYLSLELSSEIEAFRYADGELTSLGRYRTIPEDYFDENFCAEVRAASNGSTVYVSNRGHNSIAVFGINEDGTLHRRQVIGTEGEIPRHFSIDPSGRYLVAGNQNTHSVISYRIAKETGELTPTGERFDTPSPVLICFLNELSLR